MSAIQNTPVSLRPAADRHDEPGPDPAAAAAASAAAAAADAEAQALQATKRWRRLLMVGGVAIVLGISAALYLTGGRYVGTEDAYVKAAQLSVTTDVSGLVKSVNVHDGQHVKAGEMLFQIDPQPFQIGLANAQAALVQSRMTVGSLKADYQQALQQTRAQEAQVDVTKTTLDSYSALVAKGAISRTVYDQQRANYLSALATLSSLRQAAVADLAKLNGNANLPVNQFPDEMKARAALQEAQRQLDHTIVRAPFDGVVTGVGSLQPGALIISAMSAFSTTSAVGLVSDTNIWIEGNMKETDLTRVHPGQTVNVRIDTYPDCKWEGSIESIAAASGSAFSPLPAENTSGNWVKVVQRIPVRVKLAPSSCNVRLSTGMSASISIDTGHGRWHRLMNG